MKKKTIFSEDIELPRIVREKAGSAFSAIQTERSPMMTHQTNQEFPMQANKPHRSQARRVLAKRLAAAAACAALILAFGSLAKPLKKIQTAPSTAEQIDRLFTLQVKAAGMEEGNPIPLQEGCPFPMIAGSGKAASWVLGADDAEGSTVDYCIHIPQLTCEGEGIQSITYSINQGAFQIVQPRDAKSIIIDGQPYGKDLNTGSIGGKYEDAADAKATQNNTENSANAQESAPWQDDPYERVLYKSFTVDYSQQSDENTWINFCNVRPDSSEIIQLLWKEGGTEEDFFQGMQQMLGQTTITCTVNYTDNTSQSADIKVGSSLMTRREAGEILDPGMDSKELEEQTTAVTFELQQ